MQDNEDKDISGLQIGEKQIERKSLCNSNIEPLFLLSYVIFLT